MRNKEPYILRKAKETKDMADHVAKMKDVITERLVKSLSDLAYALKDVLPSEVINPIIENITDYDQMVDELKEVQVQANVYRLVNDIREGKLRVQATDGGTVSFTF